MVITCTALGIATNCQAGISSVTVVSPHNIIKVGGGAFMIVSFISVEILLALSPFMHTFF